MTNTHHPSLRSGQAPHFSILRASATAFLFMGIATMVAGNMQLYLGQLTGGGVTLLAYQAGAIPMASQMVADVSVTSEGQTLAADIHTQFILGMVMILCGFFTHLLYVRKHKKTPVQQAHLDGAWNGK